MSEWECGGRVQVGDSLAVLTQWWGQICVGLTAWMAGHPDRQLAGGIDAARKHSGQCAATLLTWKKGLHDCRRAIQVLPKCVRPSGNCQQHRRPSSLQDRFDELRLVARQESVVLSSGRTVEAWTFGSLPGPEIRVQQGDLVEVTLENRDIADGVTLHWHGYPVPNGEDGVAGVTQDAIAPGQSFNYRFLANDVGTYWYHAHQVSSEAVGRGLFGAFVVEPAGADVVAEAFDLADEQVGEAEGGAGQAVDEECFAGGEAGEGVGVAEDDEDGDEFDDDAEGLGQAEQGEQTHQGQDDDQSDQDLAQ